MEETTQHYIERILACAGRANRSRCCAAPHPPSPRSSPDAPPRTCGGPRRRNAVGSGNRDPPRRCGDRRILSSAVILSSPGVAIQAFDQNAWASAFRYADQDASASLGLFRVLRESWLNLVAGVEETWLDRYGVHQEPGEETVRHLLRLYAGHDLNHLLQISRILDEGDRPRGAR